MAWGSVLSLLCWTYETSMSKSSKTFKLLSKSCRDVEIWKPSKIFKKIKIFWRGAKWHKVVGEMRKCVGEVTQVVGEMKEFCWGNEANCWGNEAILLGKWHKNRWGDAPNTKWNMPVLWENVLYLCNFVRINFQTLLGTDGNFMLLNQDQDKWFWLVEWNVDNLTNEVSLYSPRYMEESSSPNVVDSSYFENRASKGLKTLLDSSRCVDGCIVTTLLFHGKSTCQNCLFDWGPPLAQWKGGSKQKS